MNLNLTQVEFGKLEVGADFYFVIDETILSPYRKLRHNKAKSLEDGHLGHFGNIVRVWVK